MIQVKEEFVVSISRGGLPKPLYRYIYIASVHAMFLYHDATNQYYAKKNTNMATIIVVLPGADLGVVAFTIFNIGAKTYASEMKDNLRRSKNNKNKIVNSQNQQERLRNNKETDKR